MNYLPKRLASVFLFWLLTFSLGEAKSFEYLSERDSTGVELKHFIGKHFVQRFTVTDGVAQFKVGQGKRWQEFELREFQLKPLQLKNSFLEQSDQPNGITMRVSVSVTGSAYRFKEGRNWSEWKPGSPAHLAWARVTIVKKDGKFELSESMGAEKIRKKDVRPNKGIKKL